MKRRVRMSAVTLTAMWVFAAAAHAAPGGPQGACRQEAARTVLARSMELYWRWSLGGIGPQDPGPLYLVPLPAGEQVSDDPLVFQGSQSFTVEVGRKLVLPMSFFVGEAYVDGTSDDPVDFPLDFTGSTLRLTIDGRTVLDSLQQALDCVHVPPTRFREPIEYASPTDYGAVAAIWMTGVGTVLPPLRPGRHIIELQVVSPLRNVLGVDVGYYNTWYVTVTRR